MTKKERILALAGILILGSVWVFTRTMRPAPQRRSGLAAEATAAAEPVNILADELKDAWSDHHTQA